MTNFVTPTESIPAELAYLRAKVDVQRSELAAARREIRTLRLRLAYMSTAHASSDHDATENTGQGLI